MKSALLLSGGMDSVAIAYLHRPQFAITIDYGQLPARAELTASKAVSKALNIEHHTIQIDCRSLGSGDLAGTTAHPTAPATDWWPYRNQILITFAAAKALELGASELLTGTVASDEQHADGTPDFVEAISALLAMQEGRLAVRAPAIYFTTSELIKTAGVPKDILAWAHSCHKANVACGQCRGCNKYFQVLSETGYGMD